MDVNVFFVNFTLEELNGKSWTVHPRHICQPGQPTERRMQENHPSQASQASRPTAECRKTAPVRPAGRADRAQNAGKPP